MGEDPQTLEIRSRGHQVVQDDQFVGPVPVQVDRRHPPGDMEPPVGPIKGDFGPGDGVQPCPQLLPVLVEVADPVPVGEHGVADALPVAQGGESVQERPLRERQGTVAALHLALPVPTDGDPEYRSLEHRRRIGRLPEQDDPLRTEVRRAQEVRQVGGDFPVLLAVEPPDVGERFPVAVPGDNDVGHPAPRDPGGVHVEDPRAGMIDPRLLAKLVPFHAVDHDRVGVGGDQLHLSVEVGVGEGRGHQFARDRRAAADRPRKLGDALRGGALPHPLVAEEDVFRLEGRFGAEAAEEGEVARGKRGRVLERARDDDGAPLPRFLHGGDRHVERHRFSDAGEVRGEDVGDAERPGPVAASVLGRDGDSLPGGANVEPVGQLFLHRLFEDRNGGAQRVVGPRGDDLRRKEGEGLACRIGRRGGKAQKGREEKERGRTRAGRHRSRDEIFLNSGVPATFSIWKTAVSVLATTTPASRSAAMPLR